MSGLPESIADGANLRDTRLIARAIKQRWPIPEKYREALIARQVKIATGMVEDASPREQTSAFNALLAADAMNREEETPQRETRVQHMHVHAIANQPITESNFADAKQRLLEELGG